MLRQLRTSPTVEEEDLILQPATIRANYMRYIKSRSKEKAQAKRDARANLLCKISIKELSDLVLWS